MDGIKKFEELLRTDEALQKKLQAALEAYTGEKSEKAIFANVLAPVAAEYGITATYDEMHDYILSINDNSEISDDELNQVAGGGKGVGAVACELIGLGFGANDGKLAGGMCFIGGMGIRASICMGEGKEY